MLTSENEDSVDQAKSGMENARCAKPKAIRDQYGAQLKALQEAYGKAMLDLAVRKPRLLHGPSLAEGPILSGFNRSENRRAGQVLSSDVGWSRLGTPGSAGPLSQSFSCDEAGLCTPASGNSEPV